jgi:hypothetical protein
MSQEIFAAGKPPRIPPPHDGIQVNCCKHPRCSHYGVPALEWVSRTPISFGAVHDHYELDRGTHPSVPLLHCQLCREEPPIKGNRAIAEERARLLTGLQQRPDPACPNPVCANHSIPITSDTGHYQSFGRSPIPGPGATAVRRAARRSRWAQRPCGRKPPRRTG